MLNSAIAYLKTEGKIDYRGYQVAYYTYSLSSVPNKFKVNVNVCTTSSQGLTIKTLALDDSFEKEKDAINFAIEKGKSYIDKKTNPTKK